MNKKLSTGGQILVEILLAFALVAIFMTVAVGAFVGFRATSLQSSQMLQAQTLFLEQYEALRSIREDNWDNLVIGGPYHVTISGSKWTLAAGQEQIGDFVRSLNISQVRRGPSGDTISSAGQLDPNTKKITIIISWSTPRPSSINQDFYLSRFLGNNAWVQTTKTDFDNGINNAGTTNVVTTSISGGEVILSQTPGNQTKTLGNQFIATQNQGVPITQNKAYVSLRFATQSSKTVTEVRFFQNQASGNASYLVELRADNNGNPGAILASGTYLPSNSGSTWVLVTLNRQVTLQAQSVYHIVIHRQIGGSGSLTLRSTLPPNYLIPYDNSADPNSNILSSNNGGQSWLVTNQQPVYLLLFTDSTTEGNPLNQVYDDNLDFTRVYGSNSIGEQFTVNGSDRQTTSVGFYVRKRSGSVPEDNLYVTLYNVTDKAEMVKSVIVTASSVGTNYTWYTYSFVSPQTLQAGKTYRFYLSSPSTSERRAYLLSAQETSNILAYYGRTFDRANSFYTKSSDGGNSWNGPVNRDVPFRYTVKLGKYGTSGTFESQTFDSGGSSGFNFLTWTVSKPSGTNLTFQIATNNDGLTWSYVGPDGTASTFFDSPQAVPLNSAEGRYLRFKAYFTSDGNDTSVLADVTLNYSP